MNAVEVCKFAAENGISMIRARKDGNGYDVREAFMGKKKGWILLDGFSASAVSKVYDAIEKPENREKFAKLPIMKAISIAFQFVK